MITQHCSRQPDPSRWAHQAGAPDWHAYGKRSPFLLRSLCRVSLLYHQHQLWTALIMALPQLLIALCGLPAVSQAMAHLPRQTDSTQSQDYDAYGWSPKPTQSPAVMHHGLLARQQGITQTCAYFSGNIASPIACPLPGGCCYYPEARNWASHLVI